MSMIQSKMREDDLTKAEELLKNADAKSLYELYTKEIFGNDKIIEATSIMMDHYRGEGKMDSWKHIDAIHSMKEVVLKTLEICQLILVGKKGEK